MQTDFQFNCERIWRICKRCVTIMDMQPNAIMSSYNVVTAMLLFGTCAHEGALRWERQRSPKWDGNVGGFSKWQLETASIERTRSDFKTKNIVRLPRAVQLIFNDPKATGTWLLDAPLDQILWALRMEDNDHLGVLFCREHYRRVPSNIPIVGSSIKQIPQISAIAKYWKDYYNTYLGAGTVEQFEHNWDVYCSATVAQDTNIATVL